MNSNFGNLALTCRTGLKNDVNIKHPSPLSVAIHDCRPMYLQSGNSQIDFHCSTFCRRQCCNCDWCWTLTSGTVSTPPRFSFQFDLLVAYFRIYIFLILHLFKLRQVDIRNVSKSTVSSISLNSLIHFFLCLFCFVG